MDFSTLTSYLQSVKRNFDSSATKLLFGDVHVVLGNEAADLDSVVSSIVTAYYTAHSLTKEEKENKQSFVVPVINCQKEDLPLRTEVIYFLKENGINLDHLICRNEIDLVSLQSEGKLKLTLVDHNVLSSSDTFLEGSICRVIDHHRRERPLDRRDIIESVGSCATLVSEMVLGLFDNDSLICLLLYGTILLDTLNLSPAAKRATSKDIKIVAELQDCLVKLLGSRTPNRADVFSDLVKARSDVSKLNAEQILRKDCKVLRTPEITVAFPAVPLLSGKFMELPNVLDALKTCLWSNRCTAILVLCYEVVEDTGEIKRDNIVFSDSIHKAKQVSTPLENNQELQLRQIRHSIEAQSVYWIYEQLNSTLSRKYILPFLVTHFEAKAQNQLDVDALNGVEILMPNGEMSPIKNNSSMLHPLPAVPSISYTGVPSLGTGDPISQGSSAQNSAYNSCPYTPQNSCSEPAEGIPVEDYFLPSFNSREMIEKIESKRGKLRGYDKSEDELKPGACTSYPFTPKNSYVESSSLEAVFEGNVQQTKFSERQSGGLDSELLLRKLIEKRRTDSYYYGSNSSSKSQSLTKLNIDDSGLSPGGDMMNAQLSSGPGSGNTYGSPRQCMTPPHPHGISITRPKDCPDPHSTD